MNYRHNNNLLFYRHVLAPITIGGLIYLLFRADTLLMFRWIEIVGMDTYLYNIRSCFSSIKITDISILLYSVPDGLWVYSLTAFMLFVWKGELSKHSAAWLLIGPVLATGGEIAQGLGLINGTFDLYDLVLCAIGSIAPIVVLRDKRFAFLCGR